MTPLLVIAAFLAAPPADGPLAEFALGGRSARRMAFSPDGKRLAVVAARSKEATVGGALLSLLTKGVERNGGDHDRRLFVWDVASGKERARLDVEDVTAFAFAADGRHLAVASSIAWRRFVTVWDLSGDRPRKTLDAWWDGDGIVSVALSPDGKMLATGSESGELRRWDVPAGKPAVVDRGTSAPYSLAFTADGKALTYRTLVPGKGPGEYRVRRLVKALADDKGPVVREDRVVTAADLHVSTPDGKVRFEPEASGAVVLRQEGKPVVRFRPHAREAFPVLEVSPDGKTLATGGEVVKLWDVAALRRRSADSGHR